MELKDFVLENQKVIDLVKDRTGGNTQVDMYYGTLDYATARFHSKIDDRCWDGENAPSKMQATVRFRPKVDESSEDGEGGPFHP